MTDANLSIDSMTAPGPLVPPKLRELLGLMAELGKFLPAPAGGDWNRRREVEGQRRSLLISRLDLLSIHTRDLMDKPSKFPEIDAQSLDAFCDRSIETIRAKLAEPLGYEPNITERSSA
jgi:hypothetical protein